MNFMMNIFGGEVLNQSEGLKTLDLEKLPKEIVVDTEIAKLAKRIKDLFKDGGLRSMDYATLAEYEADMREKLERHRYKLQLMRSDISDWHPHNDEAVIKFCEKLLSTNDKTEGDDGPEEGLN